METVKGTEAKNIFYKLLDRVAKGESFTIVRRGIPVAILQPVDPSKRKSVKETIAELKKSQAAHRLGGLLIREMIEEGRR